MCKASHMLALLLVGALAFLGCAASVAAAAADPAVPSGAIRVELKQIDGQWQLLRDGQPYFIRGAGGDGSKQVLADLGGNSFRTWGSDNLESQLDEAYRLGQTVTVGIWLGHERHGFDYGNAEAVAAQRQRAKQAIIRYKDHPAVLMWGIGNETEGFGRGDNAAIWKAINDIAAMAEELDPNHPTMMVMSEIGGERIKNVQELCSAIDIVGVNTYAGLASLSQRYKQAGGTKPYVVTEFGPPGTWEVGKNSFGAIVEPTSTEKAGLYRRGYESSIAGAKGLCLGSYCFAWGSKVEATSTWFGMLLSDGTQLEPVHTMAELWTGKAPANACPRVEPVQLAGSPTVNGGQMIRATLDVTDPDGDPLSVQWVLHRETSGYRVGGETESTTASYPQAIVKAGERDAQVNMPDEPGVYRLYAFVRDGQGNGATSTALIQVRDKAAQASGSKAPAASGAQKAQLPLVIFGEPAGNSPYVPSGWMGNHEAVRLDEKCVIKPHSGRVCMRMEYQADDGFGGIIWQDPPDDWGDRAGGRDLSGAKHLSFWARGHSGGEKVKFVFGIIRKDKPHFDTDGGETEVALSREWKQYTIALEGKDLSRIKTGFGWVVGGQGAPLTFYVDDVRYE